MHAMLCTYTLHCRLQCVHARIIHVYMLRVYTRRVPLFSHCHQLSIVGDKDSEITRQLYLYGGDLGSIRKNDSTVSVISLGVRLELRLGLGGKARSRDKARIRLHVRPHLPWSHSSATVCSSVHTEVNHGVGVHVLSSLVPLTTIWLCCAVCSLLLTAQHVLFLWSCCLHL